MELNGGTGFPSSWDIMPATMRCEWETMVGDGQSALKDPKQHVSDSRHIRDAYNFETQRAYARMCTSMLHDALRPVSQNPLFRMPLLTTHTGRLDNYQYLYARSTSVARQSNQASTKSKDVVPEHVLLDLFNGRYSDNQNAISFLDVLYNEEKIAFDVSNQKLADSEPVHISTVVDGEKQAYHSIKSQAPQDTTHVSDEVGTKSHDAKLVSSNGETPKAINDPRAVALDLQESGSRYSSELIVDRRKESNNISTISSAGSFDAIFNIESEDEDEPIATLKTAWLQKMKSNNNEGSTLRGPPKIVTERVQPDSYDSKQVRTSQAKAVSRAYVDSSKLDPNTTSKKHKRCDESDDALDEDFVPETKRSKKTHQISGDHREHIRRDAIKNDNLELASVIEVTKKTPHQVPSRDVKQHPNLGKDRNGSFTEEEHAAVFAEVRARRIWEETHPEAQKLRDQPFWEYILARLHARRQCMTRLSYGSLKNYWNRFGREKSQFEERLNRPKNGKLSASVQNKKYAAKH